MNKLITPKKFFIVVAILFAVMVFGYMGTPSQSKLNEIVLMLGVDMIDDEVYVTARALVPAPNGEKSMAEKTVQSKGDNITIAMDSLSLQIGKRIGLAHCNIIALSDSVLANDISGVLDYFTRTKKVGKNAILIGCGESAEDFSRAATFVTSNYATKVQNIVEHNDERLNAMTGSIESFFKGYYSETRAGIIPKLYLSKDAAFDGLESSTAVTGSLDASEAPDDDDIVYLINDGSAIVLYDGAYAFEIESGQVMAYNLFYPISKVGEITLKNVNDDNFSNATIAIEILRNSSNIVTEFVDGEPVFTLNIELKCMLEEIVSNEQSNRDIDKSTTLISDDIINGISELVSADIYSLIEQCVVYNTDIISVYKSFNRQNYNQWQTYMQNLENTDDDNISITNNDDTNISTSDAENNTVNGGGENNAVSSSRENETVRGGGENNAVSSSRENNAVSSSGGENNSGSGENTVSSSGENNAVSSSRENETVSGGGENNSGSGENNAVSSSGENDAVSSSGGKNNSGSGKNTVVNYLKNIQFVVNISVDEGI